MFGFFSAARFGIPWAPQHESAALVSRASYQPQELLVEPSFEVIVPISIAQEAASFFPLEASVRCRIVMHGGTREVSWLDTRENAITTIAELVPETGDFSPVLEVEDELWNLQSHIPHVVQNIVFETSLDVTIQDLPRRTPEVVDWYFEPWDD